MRYFRYAKVSDRELEEDLDSREGLLTYERPMKKSVQHSFLSHLAVFSLGMFMSFLVLDLRNARSQETCTDVKLRRSSLVPEELTRYSKVVRYNGTLDQPSIYRGGGKEVDDAWNDLISVGFLDLDVTEKDIRELNTDASSLARFPLEDGGGYILNIEYTHQLHCLDLLRRVNPWNYPEYMKVSEATEKRGEHAHSQDMMRTHVDHCTEMLRQILMCHADTTPVFENWVTFRSHPWPNFNTVHQCRDFDAIHKWSREHAMSSDVAWPERPDNVNALAAAP